MKLSFHFCWEGVWLSCETLYNLRKQALKCWNASYKCRAAMIDLLVKSGDDIEKVKMTRAQARQLFDASPEDTSHLTGNK